MIEKKPKCTKFYDFGAFLIVLFVFAFVVTTAEKASDGRSRAITKENLIEAVQPIEAARTYND